MFKVFENERKGRSGRRNHLALAILALTGGLTSPLSASIPQSQDFGQISVTASSSAVTLSYSLAGLSAAPAFSIAYGTEFTPRTPSCTVGATTTCTIAVTFSPKSAGLRQDALIVKDHSGNFLGTTLLHGIGLAPQMTLTPGIMSTIAGNNAFGYGGDGSAATSASLANPHSVAVDAAGNIYIADSLNEVIRKVTVATGVISTVAGTAFGVGSSGDGGPAISAKLNNPMGIAIDGAGNLYIADHDNGRIREVNAVTGIITTVAGGGAGGGADGFGDGGPATSANLSGPNDVAVDAAGNIYIADSFHGIVREVSAATGTISLLAGGGSGGGTDGLGDGAAATNAFFDNPTSVAVDAAGNVYVADTGHCLIRQINTSGIINVIAGNGNQGYAGDLGPATGASLATPNGVRVDAAGNVYIADSSSSVIRKVAAATGIITTVAGTGSNGYAGDGGAAIFAFLGNPSDVAADAAGNLYIADQTNNVIRKVTVSSSTLAFSSTSVGEASAAGFITVSNTGTQSLALSAVTVSTNFRQQTSGYVDCSATSVIVPGSNCIAAIALVPTTSGALSGTLKVTGNSLNVPASFQTTALSGTGNTAAVPRVSLSPSSLSFGNQSVGVTSAAKTVTLSNTGSAPLSILSIWLTGVASPDYSISTTCGASLAAQASCTVSITFCPAAAGARSASLMFTDGVAGSPQTVALTGTGTQLAQATVGPASLNFSNQNVGSTSAPQSITMTNSGAAVLNISSVVLSGVNAPDFSMTTTCGATLAVGASCAVNVAFSPSAAGARSASVTFTDSSNTPTQTVSLSGNGTTTSAPFPQAAVNPVSLNFSNQNVGSTSAPQSITMTNSGTATLSIYGVVLTGANAADFSITNSCGSTLAAGASCAVNVTFSPSAGGARSASVTFTDSSNPSIQTVGLTGNGTTTPVPFPQAAVTPASLNFSNQNPGSTSAPQTVTLTNSGTAALSIYSAALTGANAADFSITNSCGSMLAAGASCAVDVTFSPSAGGARSASLTFTDSSNPSTQTVTLTGTGISVFFESVPGALGQISVGADGAVWGINSYGSIYQFNSSTQGWTWIPGNLSKIIVGSASAVWGLNSSGQTYHWNATTQTWDWIAGTLAQLAVGCDGDVWGLNSGGAIYHLDAEHKTWDWFPGTLAQIAVGSDGAVWGLNPAHAVYRFNPATQSFSQVAGALSQIFVGGDGDIWGLANQSFSHFDQLTQTFGPPGAGALTTLAVGSGSNVYGLNASNQVCQVTAQSGTCTPVSGAMAQLSAGANGALWGIDPAGGIWRLNQPVQSTGMLHGMPGNFSQIAVAADGSAWALNSLGFIYSFNAATQSWTQIPGSLAQLAIAPEGVVWGLNSAGSIYRFNPATQGWTQIPGSLAHLAIGANGAVWGLNVYGSIYQFNSSTQGWTQIPGNLSQLTVGADGTVWGLNSAGQSYRFDSSAHQWRWVSGSFSQISVGADNNVWALGSQGQVYQFNPQSGTWKSMPGNLAHIAAAFDGEVWGFDSSHRVFRFDSATQNWNQVSGSLAQLAVASDAVIWGLDASGAVYRYQ